LGDWQPPEMVRRYARLSSDRPAEFVERMPGSLRVIAGICAGATIPLRGS